MNQLSLHIYVCVCWEIKLPTNDIYIYIYIYIYMICKYLFPNKLELIRHTVKVVQQFLILIILFIINEMFAHS